MSNKTLDIIKQNFRPAMQLALGIGCLSATVIQMAENIPTLGYKPQEEQKAPVMTAKQQAALTYVMGAGY